MDEVPPPIDWRAEITRVLPTVAVPSSIEALNSEIAGKLSRDWIGNHCDQFIVACNGGSVRIAVTRSETMVRYVEFKPPEIPPDIVSLMVASDVMTG